MMTINKLSFLCFLIGSRCFGQDFCMKLDSVVSCHIPLSVRTVLSLDEGALRNFDKNYQNYKVIKDSLELIAFSELELFDRKNIVSERNSVDARVVIDLYFSSGAIFTILITSKTYYEFNGTVYYLNEEIISWVNRNIVDGNLSMW